MEKHYKKNILNFFYAFDLFLAMIFLIALSPLAKKTAPKKSETYLLNPKNANSVSKITLSESGITLSLRRNIRQGDNFSDEIWTGCFSAELSNQKINGDIFPCDSKTVGNFLTAITSKTTAVKKSDSVSAWKAYGLDDSHAFRVCFFGENEEKLSELYFGIQNPLKKTVFLRASKTAIFEVDDNLSSFLTSDVSYWSDPFIFPQSLTGYSRSKSERLLRHGKLCAFVPDIKNADFSAFIDFENGSRAFFYFFKINEGYAVHPVFEAGPAFSPESKKQISSINYNYNISEWTFDNLITLLQEQ